MELAARTARDRGRAPDVPNASDAPRSLASLHLRLGALQLARAELEDLRARDGLDPAALADLAEARWRMGELDLAAAAAEEYLASGGSALIAHIIEAEAAAAGGRQADAQTHTAAVSGLGAADLDGIFAGMPRRAFWPAAPAVAGAELARSDEPASSSEAAERAMAATEPTGEPTEDGRDPSALLEAARADLASRDLDRIDAGLTRVALALRLDPTLAAPVVELLARRTEPAALVTHGDALRILGRALAAEASYRAAASALERPRRLGRPRP